MGLQVFWAHMHAGFPLVSIFRLETLYESALPSCRSIAYFSTEVKAVSRQDGISRTDLLQLGSRQCRLQKEWQVRLHELSISHCVFNSSPFANARPVASERTLIVFIYPSTVISRARKRTGPYTRSRASHHWAKIHGNRLGFLNAGPQHLWVRALEPCSATRSISGAMSLPLICYNWMQTKEVNTAATYVYCVLVWPSLTLAG